MSPCLYMCVCIYTAFSSLLQYFSTLSCFPLANAQASHEQGSSLWRYMCVSVCANFLWWRGLPASRGFRSWMLGVVVAWSFFVIRRRLHLRGSTLSIFSVLLSSILFLIVCFHFMFFNFIFIRTHILIRTFYLSSFPSFCVSFILSFSPFFALSFFLSLRSFTRTHMIVLQVLDA